MKNRKDAEAWVRRLSPYRIIEHWIGAVTFGLLALTGLPQKFYSHDLSQWIIMSLGGIDRLDRSFEADPSGLGKMNVVVIVEESLGAGFVGAYGDTRGLTPNFDRLAGQGLLFKNAYAMGTRTVRGLEAITASFPPIPSVSILRRPGSEGIATWGKVMQENGYATSFLYGATGILIT